MPKRSRLPFVGQSFDNLLKELVGTFSGGNLHHWARPRTRHRERPGHVRICNSFKHFIFVFSTQVSYFNLSLMLSFNLSDFIFFSRNSVNTIPGTWYMIGKKRPRRTADRCAPICQQGAGDAVIAHGFWAHIGSIPWATSNRQTSQLALRRGASRTARNLFTPSRTASDPSTTAGSIRCLWVQKSISHKVSISSATAFRLSRHQPPATRPTLLSCTWAAAMRSIELVCSAP